MKHYLLALMFVTLGLNAQQAHYRHHGKYLLPDTSVTPGAVNKEIVADLTKNHVLEDNVELNICAKGFTTKAFRHTSEKLKKEVCKEYGATDCPNPSKGEIDHLIPLELGGQDVLANLWWQPAPEYHVKDHQVEDKLKSIVCKGEMSLPEAQSCIRTDWVSCAAKIQALLKGRN